MTPIAEMEKVRILEENIFKARLIDEVVMVDFKIKS